jgi:hypothetical protein
MRIGPALDAVLRTTTVDESRAAGALDAIVVGAGAGGLAALLSAEVGLRLLALDAAWRQSAQRSWVRRATATITRTLADPATLRLLPPTAVPLGKIASRSVGSLRQRIQSRCSIWGCVPQAL